MINPPFESTVSERNTPKIGFIKRLKSTHKIHHIVRDSFSSTNKNPPDIIKWQLSESDQKITTKDMR